jgi:mannose-6-phosphate isomerase-like protein (cupin superfamily)
MKLKTINLAQAFSSFSDYWSPRVGGDINDFQIKLAKFRGEFNWHHHASEDELFLVVQGDLLMKLMPENGGDQLVRAGEYIVVPRGVEHCPTALSEEVHCILFEPNTTLNTGNTCNERTVSDLIRIAG